MKLFIRRGWGVGAGVGEEVVVTAVAVTCRLQLNRVDNGGEEA